MRIWLQSGSAGIDPTAAKYEESMMRRVKEVARPDTILVLHGPEKPLPVRDRFLASRQLRDLNFIKYALQAEKEGYDALAVTSTRDDAYDAIREVTEIPVAFITEVSCHLACCLAPRFGFLAHSAIILAERIEMAKRYGLAERMVPGSHLNLTYREFNKMYADPQPYIDLATRVAREVVKQGANLLIVSGNPLAMFLYDHGVREVDGAPVFDSLAALIKVAELMVDLKRIGITRKPLGPHGVPSAEELVAIRKAYGVE